jgi:hypothetical protein
MTTYHWTSAEIAELADCYARGEDPFEPDYGDHDLHLLEDFDADDIFGDGMPDGFAVPMIRGAADLDDEIPF